MSLTGGLLYCKDPQWGYHMGRPRITRICTECGRLLHSHQYKFCSNACQQNKKWQEIKNEIEKNGYFKATINGKIPKRYLIERYGRKCSICGIDTWQQNPTPIILDHINGNSEDWSIKNLRLVCPNCNALLPTFAGKNKGKGRFWRRQRYQEGKSC